MEWPFSAEETKVAVAGAFGAFIATYLRHPCTLAGAAGRIVIGTGCASVFTYLVADWLGWPVVPAAVVIGLTSYIIAGKVLAAAEKWDALGLIKRGKE